MGCIGSTLQPKANDDDVLGTMKVADPVTPQKLSMVATETSCEKDLAVPSLGLSSETGVMDTLRKISMSSLSKVSASHLHKVSSTLTFWRPSATMEDVPLLHQPTPGMEDFDRRLTTSTGSRTCFFPTSQYILRYSYATVCGWYPGSIYKDNQDALVALEGFGDDVEQVFFGVFDGHGEHGEGCSRFAKTKIPQLLLNSPHFPDDPVLAFHDAMTGCNSELRDHAEVDDYSSGTTAVTALVKGHTVYVSNVGDSRCVLAKKEEDGSVVAINMSNDHTPYRLDEMERVKQAGARVLTMQQVEGKKDPDGIVWGAEETADEADPPRLWLKEDPLPGTAFTRSIGDALAESIGVIPDPEVTEFEVTESTPFLVMASDGVFEFMTSQMVVDMVVAHERPDHACVEIAKAAYQNWLDAENRVDDITVIIAQFVGVQNKGPAPCAPRGSAPAPVRVPSNADFERSKSQKQISNANGAIPEENACLLKVPADEQPGDSSTTSSSSSSSDEEDGADKKLSADGAAPGATPVELGVDKEKKNLLAGTVAAVAPPSDSVVDEEKKTLFAGTVEAVMAPSNCAADSSSPADTPEQAEPVPSPLTAEDQLKTDPSPANGPKQTESAPPLTSAAEQPMAPSSVKQPQPSTPVPQEADITTLPAAAGTDASDSTPHTQGLSAEAVNVVLKADAVTNA